MHVARYLGLTLEAEQAWIDALALVARRHPTEPDICEGARLLSSWAQDHLHTLGPITERFGLLRSLSANALRKALFGRRRAGTLGLLRDLQDLYLLATQTRSCWTVLRQAARALHDGELERTAEYCGGETMRALAWLDTKIHQTTPQAVTVPAASQTETLALPANHPGLAAIAEVLCLSLRRPSLLVAVMLGAGGGTVVGLRGLSRASLRRAIPVLALNMAFVAFLLDRGRAGRVARSSSVAAANAGLRGIQPTMTLES
jgi:hypothetical protein